jgi:serine/threonine protein kinase
MGEVHRAEDLEAAADSPHRQVAVKTLLRSRTGGAIDTSGSGKETARFRREVRIMRMLSQGHPNLTLLIDGGVDDSADGGGLPYLAMELLDGNPLADLIDEEPQLPVSWVAAVGAQIASGLTAAHTAGVVQRRGASRRPRERCERRADRPHAPGPPRRRPSPAPRSTR